MDIPSHYRLAFSAEQIRESIARIAASIDAWAREVTLRTGSQPLAVCVLRGGAFFFTDLLRHLTTSVEVGFCSASSYSSETNTQVKGVSVSIGDIRAAGRTILVVDDICDTGSTLKKLQTVLQELGAEEIKSAVLIKREIQGSSVEPDWAAFHHRGDEWFVGFGMEDKNRFANLSEVYAISGSEGA